MSMYSSSTVVNICRTSDFCSSDLGARCMNTIFKKNILISFLLYFSEVKKMLKSTEDRRKSLFIF
jgi:hypothetical protein